ncbi:uncharacterized protein N7496_000522 [Penicillium cataractarum]|uniref:Protein kinase domain-containing protein n=1 Tax=Penicillium cataractarum TaxID=2100454 RepID=A0A9W9VUG9_9EURO|nr:uncharacterized protein N7496_000522 [Penicillium cataractarum]KAJ5389454.1 hypothetical protein N7496_000522 [Penicillium cataractarum]
MRQQSGQPAVLSDGSVQALVEAKCLGHIHEEPNSCPRVTETSTTEYHQGKPAGHVVADTKIGQQDQDLPSYLGLDGWRLLARIGQGAFSTVYRAHGVDSNADRGEVAVKVMRKFEMNQQQLSNLQKEIDIMRRLDQKNTTRLIDAFESRQYCYIIMELCSGGELFAQIVKLTYLSEALSRHVITQVAEAVKYLHLVLGVVHRRDAGPCISSETKKIMLTILSDIKPENILFDAIPLVPSKFSKPSLPGEEDKLDEGDFIPGVGFGGIGHVKLADYGLSRIIDGNWATTPCGTLGYAAPETMCNDRYSTGVDMWALGCVLYAMLVGYPPFYDPDMRTMIQKVSNGNFEFQSPWWDNISSDAKDLILNLLTVDPGKRLDIEEFLSHPWIKNESSYHREGVKAQIEHSDVADISSTTIQAESQTPGPLAESRIEARTPDAMNVREIFGVAFSVHQQQADDHHHQPVPKRIEQRAQALPRPTSTCGLPLNGIVSKMNRCPMHEKAFLSDHSKHRHLLQLSELPSGLNMSQSVLLKRRRIQQEQTLQTDI